MQKLIINDPNLDLSFDECCLYIKFSSGEITNIQYSDLTITEALYIRSLMLTDADGVVASTKTNTGIFAKLADLFK